MVYMEDKESRPKGVVHSNRIKAGKRTYFIDVRATKLNDYYITLTESTKKGGGDKEYFVRNKILLYKEDFNKVLNGLVETVEMVKNELLPDYDFDKFDRQRALNETRWNEESESMEATESDERETEST